MQHSALPTGDRTCSAEKSCLILSPTRILDALTQFVGPQHACCSHQCHRSSQHDGILTTGGVEAAHLDASVVQGQLRIQLCRSHLQRVAMFSSAPSCRVSECSALLPPAQSQNALARQPLCSQQSRAWTGVCSTAYLPPHRLTEAINARQRQRLWQKAANDRQHRPARMQNLRLPKPPPFGLIRIAPQPQRVEALVARHDTVEVCSGA